MKRGTHGKIVRILILFSAVILIGAEAGDPGQDEQGRLGVQASALRARIEALKREQDYLLFRNAMYHSDSKYLILNITSRTGMLMYRNRLLKDFKFRFSKNFPAGAGIATMTKKSEDKKNRRALVFGALFLIHGKGTPIPRTAGDAVVVSVIRKDIPSLYYALEEGAMAYIER